MSEHKRLSFLRQESWQLLCGQNVRFCQTGLTLGQQQYQGGYLLLHSIDSGQDDFPWSRLSLDCHLPSGSLIRSYAYGQNSKLFGEDADLDAQLKTLPPAQAQTFIQTNFQKCSDSEDCYLPVRGRYLWLAFELVATGDAPILQGLHVQLSGDHMIDYLPEIYRRDSDFTKAFLSIFDSMYMDMEQQIDAIARRFDYEKTEGSMLEYLADWVCIDADGLDGESLKTRIASAYADFEDMYTPAGIKRSIRRLTGREPILIESADVDPNSARCAHSGLYRQLYGDNPYKFFILLEEDSFHSRAEMDSFLVDMASLIPAHTEFELVLLKRCVQLDRHTYLGLNSVVGNYVSVVLNENTTIQYDTTIGGKGSEGE